jgi:23S rRNA pseudouridine1911/1915/1917 synthase
MICIDEALNPNFLPSTIDLEVLYGNSYLLIIHKPSGVSSQPSRKHPMDNVISMVAKYYQEQAIQANIHIVTRLDYRTTGIMVIAKSGPLQQMLTEKFVGKKYLCWIVGSLNPLEGMIDYPIESQKTHDIRRWVGPNGQNALTKYRTLLEEKGKSLLEVELLTGRTHQIRVHMAYLGHPVLGDNLYSNQEENLHLHCYEVAFLHPITHEKITITHLPLWLKEKDISHLIRK